MFLWHKCCFLFCHFTVPFLCQLRQARIYHIRPHFWSDWKWMQKHFCLKMSPLKRDFDCLLKYKILGSKECDSFDMFVCKARQGRKNELASPHLRAKTAYFKSKLSKLVQNEYSSFFTSFSYFIVWTQRLKKTSQELRKLPYTSNVEADWQQLRRQEGWQQARTDDAWFAFWREKY